MATERLVLSGEDDDNKIEHGLKGKSYDQLLTELTTNTTATEYVTQQAGYAQARLDTMLSQKSVLAARRQAIIEEITSREQA